MKNLVKLMVGLLGMVTMMVFGASCTNEDSKQVVTRTAKAVEPTPDPERYATYDFGLGCVNNGSSFEHTGTSTIQVFVKGTEEPEWTKEASLKSRCVLTCNPDTIRVSDGYEAKQQSVSMARSRVGNLEKDTVRIVVSDGRTLTLAFEADHASELYLGKTYVHGHDSIINAYLVGVENTPIIVNDEVGGAQYIKAAFKTTYNVQVNTATYAGGKAIASHNDILQISGITLNLADNGSTDTEGGSGVEILNETQQKDSVIITTTWSDGHSENVTYPTILERWLKNVEKREVVVSSFEDRTAETSFSKEVKAETLVREDDLWTVYGREVVITKNVTVNGISQEITYTYYQERADFHHKSGVKHSFDYIDWAVTNYNDNFKSADEKDGNDVLSYENEIRTDYAGFVKMANEAIDWLKPVVKVTGYGAIDALRQDFATYSHIEFTKVEYTSDGKSKTIEKVEENLPISVERKTNWSLYADVWGVYTSGDFAQKLNSKSSEIADGCKFISYNRYVYNFSNEVSGQTNAFEVSIPNDIVYNDGDVEVTFANTELSVEKKSEGTSYVGEDEDQSTYTYACVAGVTFGASQDVTLPGTIYLAKEKNNPDPENPNNPDPDPNNPDPEPNPNPDTPVVVNHAHGKVVGVYMTSTLNENRASWYNVCAIVFEDGYRSIGMAKNNDTEFNFTMESTTDKVNSAVYYGNAWHPSIATDASSAMAWYDESGKGRRSLSYTAATAMRWNNGHNTIEDVRRKGEISLDGYSVTLYLNGLAGQTLNF